MVAHRSRFLLLATASVISGLLEGYVLVLVTSLAISVTDSSQLITPALGPTLSIRQATLVACILLAARLTMAFVAARVQAALSAEVTTGFRTSLVRAFFSASWEKISQERLGDMQVLLTTHTTAATGAVDATATLLIKAANLIALMVVAFVASPVAALVAIAFAIGIAGMLRPIVALTRRSAQALQLETRQLGTATTEATRLAVEARTLGIEHRMVGQLDELFDTARETMRRAKFALLIGPQLYQTAGLLLIALGAGAVATLDIANVQGVGATLVLLLRAFSNAQGGQNAYQRLTNSLPYLEGIKRREAELVASAPPPDTGIERVDSNEWAVRDVSFSYDGETPVLDGVSLSVASGEIVGIMGASGAGKSTLVELLLGLRQPDRGSLRLGDHEVSTIPRHCLVRHVGYVPQEPRLTTASIGDNIRFFRSLPDNAVVDAAVSAHVHDEIMARPGAYDASAGEAGAGLSGGQRQRLTVARALAAGPTTLILDEPTSSLDRASEEAINQTLWELRGEVTAIVVSHRPSTLAICDRVLTLQNGVLIEEPVVEQVRH